MLRTTDSFVWFPNNVKIVADQCQYVSNFACTHPSPSPTLTLTCYQLTVVGLGEGQVHSCSGTDLDPTYLWFLLHLREKVHPGPLPLQDQQFPNKTHIISFRSNIKTPTKKWKSWNNYCSELRRLIFQAITPLRASKRTTNEPMKWTFYNTAVKC